MRAKQVTIPFSGGPVSLFSLLGIQDGQRGSWAIKMQSPASNTQDILWGDKNQQPMILGAVGVTEEVLPNINLKDLHLRTTVANQILNVAIWQ